MADDNLSDSDIRRLLSSDTDNDTESDKALTVPKVGDITLPDSFDDTKWADIVDPLVEQLAQADWPEDVIKATEMMMVGIPTYKIAKKLGMKSSRIRGWLTKYPGMALIVENSRALLSKWRMTQLENQFITAIEISEEALEGGPTGPADADQKMLATMLQHARFIINLFAGKKTDVDIKVSHEMPALKAQQGALDYIAEKMQEKRELEEEVIVTARVIDRSQGPIYDDEGQPFHGDFGVMDRNADGVQCHICGERFDNLDIHIRTVERLSLERYEQDYLLEPGSVMQAQRTADGEAEDNDPGEAGESES